MNQHPYHAIPRYSRWKQGVGEGVEPREMLAGLNFRGLTQSDRVFSAGSCFASHVGTYLERSGITYVRTERRPSALAASPDGLGYETFSARFGNIYTSRQFLQLLVRCTGNWAPEEDRWRTGGGLVDPFRPGLKYLPASDDEFDAVTKSHLSATRAAIEAATVVIFTLGLTEAWHANDGAVFPVCPGTVAGDFDPSRHHFTNLTVGDVASDLRQARSEISRVNPTARFVVTVSPVPLVATATGKHAAVASLESKSILRAAVAEAQRQDHDIEYFPSYELLMGWQTPPGCWERDMRTVTKFGLDYVMSTLLPDESSSAVERVAPEADAAALSKLVTEVECEEAQYEKFA